MATGGEKKTRPITPGLDRNSRFDRFKFTMRRFYIQLWRIKTTTRRVASPRVDLARKIASNKYCMNSSARADGVTKFRKIVRPVLWSTYRAIARATTGRRRVGKLFLFCRQLSGSICTSHLDITRDTSVALFHRGHLHENVHCADIKYFRGNLCEK